MPTSLIRRRPQSYLRKEYGNSNVLRSHELSACLETQQSDRHQKHEKYASTGSKGNQLKGLAWHSVSASSLPPTTMPSSTSHLTPRFTPLGKTCLVPEIGSKKYVRYAAAGCFYLSNGSKITRKTTTGAKAAHSETQSEVEALTEGTPFLSPSSITRFAPPQPSPTHPILQFTRSRFHPPRNLSLVSQTTRADLPPLPPSSTKQDRDMTRHYPRAGPDMAR